MDVGKLRVLIGGDTTGLKNSVREAKASLDTLVAAAGAVVAALAVVSAVKWGAGLVKQSLDVIDAQSKLAVRLGGTIQALQTLTVAGDLAGVSQDELGNILGRLNQRLGEAARTASGPTYEALRRLGLSAKELMGLDLDKRLEVIADKMQALGYNSAQQADTLRQLGIRSQGLLTIFEEGGDSIRSAREEVRQFGIAVTAIDGRKVEAANDAWTRVGFVIRGIANQLAVNLAGPMKYVADRIVDAAKEAGGFQQAIRNAVEAGIVGIGTLIDNVRAMVNWVKQSNSEWTYLKDIMAAIGHGPNIPRAWEGIKKAQEDYAARTEELKKSASSPPTFEPWLNAYRKAMTDMDKEAEAAAKKADERNSKPPAKVDPYSTEQRKALEDRVLALRQALANEAQLLDLHKEKQLRDIAELASKGMLTQQQVNDMKLQAEAKYQDARTELIQQKLEAGILAEDEVLARKYAKQLEDLQNFENAQTITTEEAEKLRAKIGEKYAENYHRIQASKWSAAAGVIDSAMSNISDVIGTEGDKQFGIMKAISMATALMKGYEAVMGAYTAGNNLGGPVVGAAFAAVAAAGTAAILAKIAGVNSNSGGGGGSGGASGVPAQAPPVQTAEQAPQDRNLYVQGINRKDLYSGESVREIAQALIDFQKDGGKVVLSP